MFGSIRTWLFPEMKRSDSRVARKYRRAATLRYRQPRFEALEDRRMLSVSPVGPEFRVNTYTLAGQWTSQTERSTAMDADGNFVCTWTSWEQPGFGFFGV